MPSANDLRKEADRREAEARAAFDRATADAQRELDRALGAVRALRVAADALDGHENESLPSAAQYGTNGNMNTSAIAKQASPAPRARGRDITSDSPIGEAAKQLGMTLKELAMQLGYSYDTVRKWSAKGSVPVDVQQRIDALLKAPPSPASGKRARKAAK